MSNKYRKTFPWFVDMLQLAASKTRSWDGRSPIHETLAPATRQTNSGAPIAKAPGPRMAGRGRGECWLSVGR